VGASAGVLIPAGGTVPFGKVGGGTAIFAPEAGTPFSTAVITPLPTLVRFCAWTGSKAPEKKNKTEKK